MKFVKAIMIGAVVIAGAAYAKGDRTDPNAKARSDLMRVVGKNTGILGDMAGGKAAYDAWVPAFEALFAQQGQRWDAFYDAVRHLAALPQDERHARLQALLPPPHQGD